MLISIIFDLRAGLKQQQYLIAFFLLMRQYNRTRTLPNSSVPPNEPKHSLIFTINYVRPSQFFSSSSASSNFQFQLLMSAWMSTSPTFNLVLFHSLYTLSFREGNNLERRGNDFIVFTSYISCFPSVGQRVKTTDQTLFLLSVIINLTHSLAARRQKSQQEYYWFSFGAIGESQFLEMIRQDQHPPLLEKSNT